MSKSNYLKIALLGIFLILILAIGWVGWMSSKSLTTVKSFYSQYNQCVTSQDKNCFNGLVSSYPKIGNLISDASANVVIPKDDNFSKLSLNVFSTSYLIPLQNPSFSVYKVNKQYTQIMLSGYTPALNKNGFSQAQVNLISQIFSDQIFQTGQMIKYIFDVQSSYGKMIITNYFIKQ